jgi:hypothetical protein
VKFYHGTSRLALQEMQKEGVLWGKGRSYRSRVRFTLLPFERYTYLSPDPNIARRFGAGVLLEVEYEPKGNVGRKLDEIEDNFQFVCPPDIKYEPGMFCWQFSVFVPIPMAQVKVLEDDEIESLEIES